MAHFFPEPERSEGRGIASWGTAKLIKTLDGKYELVGGSKEDVKAAHEWISLFMPDAVIPER